MEGEVKEKLEVIKRGKTLPTPLTKRGKANLVKLQGEYQMKYGRKISIKSLGSKVFEHAKLNF